MKCPHCKVEVACRTTVCPLCHVPFNNVEGTLDEARKLPRAFPAKGRAPLFSTSIFDKVYLGIALYLAALAVILEFIFTGQIKSALAVAAALFYIYFSIRFTFQNTGYFTQKMVAQTVVLSVVAFFFRNVFPRPVIVFEFILPGLYLAAMVSISIYILIKYRYPQKYLLNLLSIAILGIMPVIILCFFETDYRLLSILTASFGGAVILALFLFSGKKIKQEFIRLFHL